MLVIAYHLLKRQCPYQELGADYFDRLNEHALTHRLVKRLIHLGYQVTLKPGRPEPAPDTVLDSCAVSQSPAREELTILPHSQADLLNARLSQASSYAGSPRTSVEAGKEEAVSISQNFQVNADHFEGDHFEGVRARAATKKFLPGSATGIRAIQAR
jgi:hypothetical protein